ncbi:MAG TPA: hypothetical protein VHL57_11300 [Flavobacteriales bacterium]|jgi:hypothetical protein|nr:hypothetical protein [Flavobacteriales bacterium]
MDTPGPVDTPLPEEVREERKGRQRMWRWFVLGLIVVAAIIYAGTRSVPRTEGVQPTLDTLR